MSAAGSKKASFSSGLDAVNPTHQVACLLTPETRKQLWGELSAGAAPDAARKDVMKEEEVA